MDLTVADTSIRRSKVALSRIEETMAVAENGTAIVFVRRD
jgi:hypothetical protein